jgi:hypothetical protein
MIKEIINWLNSSRDYSTGVRIIQIHTPFTATVSSLNRFRDERKLLNIINRLYEESKPIKKEPEVQTIPIENIEQNLVKLPASALDADIAIQKLTEARNLWKQAGNAHSQLKTSKAQGKRKRIAFFILETTQKARELFKQVDFYNKNGHFYQLPNIDKSEIDQLPAEDMKALIKRRASIRSSISSYKKKIRKGEAELANMSRIQMSRKNKELAQYQMKIEMWQNEINELNTKIDG